MAGLGALARKLFGSANDRRIKQMRSRVDAINALEEEVKGLSDDELRARTATFREELAAGKKLDHILEPAFATVRNPRHPPARSQQIGSGVGGQIW